MQNDTDLLIAKLEDMKRMENCFVRIDGTVDLMEMSARVPEHVFREYCQASREWRERRRQALQARLAPAAR